MIKKILLTGATGFIGSHLLEELLKNDYQVTIVKRSSSDTWRINGFSGKVKFIGADLAEIENFFQENKIDCIVHLATYYVKRHRNLKDIEDMIGSNIKFPAALVDLGIGYGIKNFINTGTFFEYKQKHTAITEKDKMTPYNFYAATKIAFNEILKYYCASQNLRVIDLKLFAPFGEKDNEKLVVAMIKSILGRNKPLALTDGNQKWNFTYVKDIVAAYIRSLEKIEELSGYNFFNIGYDKPHSLREMVAALEKISRKKPAISWGAKPLASDEILYVNCDSGKAQKVLGWKPKHDFYSGLEKTYEYYFNNQ